MTTALRLSLGLFNNATDAMIVPRIGLIMVRPVAVSSDEAKLSFYLAQPVKSFPAI